MTREELLQLISEVQQRQSELDDIEVKLAQGGTPQRLFEPRSAFANRVDAAVIPFRLDERRDFEAAGVGNMQYLKGRDYVSSYEPGRWAEYVLANQAWSLFVHFIVRFVRFIVHFVH